MRWPRQLPGTVVALGVVSLLTDLASEMIFPLLPLYVVGTLGGGALAVGLIEGVAESTAALVKLASGAWSDRLARRKPLVVAGYGVASAVRPLVGLVATWPAVLAIRFADRIGKGLRSAPRDALLVEAVDADRRGAAFGFHRAMDHSGAVLGPLVAAGLIALGWSLGDVFLVAAIPGAIVMLVLVFGVAEAPRPEPLRPREPLAAPALPRDLRRLLVAVALFALGNSTDAFLLLRLSVAGLAAGPVALLWSVHHVVKVIAALAGGALADRAPRRAVVVAGWSCHAACYLGFALVESRPALIAIFLAYGAALGLAEPAEKAWIADLAPAGRRGAAFGWLHGVTGAAALPASAGFGLLWGAAGAPIAFLTGGALAVVAVVVLAGVRAPSGPAALHSP